jgi:hypothetical protein
MRPNQPLCICILLLQNRVAPLSDDEPRKVHEIKRTFEIVQTSRRQIA